jgi:oligopeptide/dipeptide ABC transporter ATP-binding protein
MTLLEIQSLETQFDTERGTVQAVDGVDLTVDAGEIVGLVGESGSGKTVLAESVAGLLEPPGEVVGGDIRLHGESLVDTTTDENQPLRSGRIAMIFQDPMNSLNPTMQVGEQIAEAVRLHQDVDESVSLPAGIKRKLFETVTDSEAWRRAVDMLEAVEITDPSARATDYPHQFSGGMQQRAMIALALSCEPDLLIADEPTTALDVTVQAQILEEITELREAFGTSVLLITHDLAVVSEVCDRVNVMYAGEIVERATVDDLFQSPAHPYTQALLESVPRIDAEPGQELSQIPGSVPDLVDIPYACHFAPRCPEAKRACLETDPDFREVATSNPTRDANDSHTHEAACLRRGQPEDRL